MCMRDVPKRTCSKCGTSKPSSEFYSETREGKTRIRCECKECTRKKVSEYQKSHRVKINEHRKAPGSQYKSWRKEYTETHKERRAVVESAWRQTAPGVYCMLRASAKKRMVPFEIEKEAFFEWYQNETKKCVYCDMVPEEIRDYRGHDALRLTVDRKDPNSGYSLGNIVLACPICNTVKNNILTYAQMLEVGKMIKENRQMGLIKPSYKNGKTQAMDAEHEVGA